MSGRTVTTGRGAPVGVPSGVLTPWLEAERATEIVDPRGRFPGEVRLRPPEVAVRGGGAIDRAPEVEIADDRRGPQVKELVEGRRDLRRVDGLGPEGLDHDRDRAGD